MYAARRLLLKSTTIVAKRFGVVWYMIKWFENDNVVPLIFEKRWRLFYVKQDHTGLSDNRFENVHLLVCDGNPFKETVHFRRTFHIKLSN